ncbi:BREX-1 system phosphatase PglZ type A [Paenibacillus sp. CMAA1364]
MNLQTIQEKLNEEFKSSERKLVFWYDDNGEFAEEVDSLELANASLHKLTGDNALYTKYLLECKDLENSYLIYAPFPKPMDRENHLADMIYYSKQFYADRVSLLCADLHIPERYKEQLSGYPKFWRSNERVEKFATLGIENYNPETIEIGLLSVMAGVRTPSFEEILKTVIISGDFTDNKYITSFDKMGILKCFWHLCDKYYGFNDEKPSVEKLVATLLITYTVHHYKGELPKSWEPYVSHKKNDSAVFVSNLMNSMLYKDQFDLITEQIAVKIKANEFFENVTVDSFFECDTFEVFDLQILSHLATVLVSTAEPLSESYREVIKKRSSKKHFSVKYVHHYKIIDRADQLIGEIQRFSKDSAKNADEVITLYTTKWAKIDKYYRGFYTAYDLIESNDRFHELRNLVENIYTNSYLMKLSVLWAEKLEQVDSINNLTGQKQYDFYNRIVAPAAKKECTVVIISDGFRYECGMELHERFKERAGTSSELESMLSVIPSYTRLGMAGLLPHKSITFTESYDVLVNGEPCSSSVQREKILKSYNPLSVVTTYSDVIVMSREAVRKLMTGQEIIYIYHNQVDARGDHAPTENEVFSAAKESIHEIIKLIQKLTVDKSITNYMITADHGFIYKRDKLDESDKVNLPKQEGSLVNKRYILSKEPLAIEGSLCYGLDYLSGENKDIYVTVPRGADIFKAPGGGQNFVHGGASLQEIIVPLLKVKTERYKKDVGNVEVALTSLSRKITNLITYLDFIQTENVSDTLQAIKINVCFETESGEKISDEELIVADRKNATPDKRQFHEKFTFKNRKYSKNEKYYLVMKDAGSDMELTRHEYIIDIALADDFGFSL